jgi:bifunctional DNase/RNase
MAVGSTEAPAIAKQRSSTHIPPDRQPQAYDLLRDMIQQFGARVHRAVVNDATQREYLAQVARRIAVPW